MHNVQAFLKIYWQHARSVLDLVTLVVSLVAIFFGAQTVLAAYFGVALLFIVIVVAAYKTWLYQYNQMQKMIEQEEKEIEYDDLNDIQKAILQGMSTESDKKIISIGTMGGVVFTGIGNTGNDHDGSEIEAEIAELEKIDILRIDTYNKSGRPVYKPTSRGFKILKKLQDGK